MEPGSFKGFVIMSDDDRTRKLPNEARKSIINRLLDRLSAAESLILRLTAVIVAIGLLGAATYPARNEWIKIFSHPGDRGPTTAPTPSRTTPSPILSTTSPVPPPAVGSAQIVKVTSAEGSSCIGNSVEVTVNVSDPASADRELWLMAVVMTGAPIHPVYYAEHKVANTPGVHRVNIQFIGAPVGSARNLAMVSSAQKSLRWLQDNLANDSNPAWGRYRVNLPSGVREISRPYMVLRRC
jgi:hypothetical protein